MRSVYFIFLLLGLTNCSCGDREVYVKDPVVQCYSNEDCQFSVCVLGQCIPGDCNKDADCTPLDPTCMTSTMSLLQPIGTCNEDFHCVYERVEEECEYGCNFDTGACITDPCAGVTCQDPPSVCYAGQGACEDGACVYPPRNDLPCDDENACTQNDLCSEGVCIGEIKTCDAAQPDTCADELVLRSFIDGTGICDSSTGLCEYQYDDHTCEVACGLIEPSELDAGTEAPTSSDDNNTALADGGHLGDAGALQTEPTPLAGPYADCLPDQCIGVDCDDGNPCTEDICDSVTGECSHEILNSQQLCLTGEAQCGEGRCVQGECLSFDSRSCVRPGRCTEGSCVSGSCQAVAGGICQAEVPVDLCSDMEVPGHCAATGECVADEAAPSQCDGVQCNGLCLQCTIGGLIPLTFCWEF